MLSRQGAAGIGGPIATPDLQRPHQIGHVVLGAGPVCGGCNCAGRGVGHHRAGAATVRPLQLPVKAHLAEIETRSAASRFGEHGYIAAIAAVLSGSPAGPASAGVVARCVVVAAIEALRLPRVVEPARGRAECQGNGAIAAVRARRTCVVGQTICRSGRSGAAATSTTAVTATTTTAKAAATAAAAAGTGTVTTSTTAPYG